jgi:hypothetical protein
MMEAEYLSLEEGGLDTVMVGDENIEGPGDGENSLVSSGESDIKVDVREEVREIGLQSKRWNSRRL